MPKNKWVNVAVLGCGKVFQDLHRNAFPNAASTNNALIALCEMNQPILTEQFEWVKKQYERRLKQAEKKAQTEDIERLKYALANLKTYTSMEKMLEEMKGTVDVIDNCLPNKFHVPFSIKIMEAGFHVMSEKPSGLNWWEVRALVEAEKRTGKSFQLMSPYAYANPIWTMRKAFAEGKVGKIQEVWCNGGHGGPYLPVFAGETGLPHFIDPVLSGGGCLQDMAPHSLSRVFFPLGAGAKVVACDTKKLEGRKQITLGGKDFENKVDDYAEADLEIFDPRTNSNFIVHSKVQWRGELNPPFKFQTENGSLTVEKHEMAYEPCLTDASGKQTFIPLEKDQWDAFDGHTREIQIFCENIRNGQPSNTPAEYALRLQELISIQYFSKLMKRRVTIEEMNKWGEEQAKLVADPKNIAKEITLKLIKNIDFV